MNHTNVYEDAIHTRRLAAGLHCPYCTSPVEVLDIGLARARRDEAMARADAGADPGWKQAARAIIDGFTIGQLFTSDDIWVALPAAGRPREPRALGPLIKAAQRAGLIEQVRVDHSQRPSRNRGLVTVWRRMAA